jgi:predicted RNase H-like HicB family nuclease
MSKVVFIVEKADVGYAAYYEDLDSKAIFTMGDTMAELKANIVEAYNLHQEETSGEPITVDDVAIKFDLPQFFEHYKEINARGLAKRIGMNETLLSQYVKGVKVPSEKQVQKILQGIRDLGKELFELA